MRHPADGLARKRFNDVSFEIPEEWVDLSVVTLVGSDSKRFAPNVVITREDLPDGDLAEFAKSQLPDFRRAVKKYELVSKRTETIADREAFVLEHKFMTPQRVMVRQLQYFVRSHRDVIVLSLTCAESEVAARTEALKSIAASLVIG